MALLLIYHKYRETNQVAHYLATLALNGSFIWHNIDEVDFSCKYLLHDNQQAISFTRY